MSDNTLRPSTEPAVLPFRRNVNAVCPICSAWPLEVCEPGCLEQMTPDERHQHRVDVVRATVAELDRFEALPAHTPYTPPIDSASAPRRRVGRLVLVALVLVLVLTLGGFWLAGRAGAAPLPGNCQQQPWLYGGLFGRMTTRTICDGPIRPDGSWLRNRNFYAQTYYKPFSCSGGTYSWSCNGGYQVPEFDTGVEQYTVTADTVLPDEPGHIGGL